MRLLILLLLLSAPAGAANLEVSAAASLTGPFREIGALYTKATGQTVAFNFGATNELRVQIENGAPADVFASASAEEMERARAHHAVDTPAVFAHNRLVVVTPADDPGHVAALKDLARPGLKLVTAHPNVPVGKYFQAMLAAMGKDPAYGAAWAAAAAKNVVSQEVNVKQVVAKVALGEADAGVVYVSDVVPRLRAIPVPDAYNVQAAYPIAITAGSHQPDAARRFVQLVLSPEGRAILARHGFAP